MWDCFHPAGFTVRDFGKTERRRGKVADPPLNLGAIMNNDPADQVCVCVCVLDLIVVVRVHVFTS